MAFVDFKLDSVDPTNDLYRKVQQLGLDVRAAADLKNQLPDPRRYPGLDVLVLGDTSDGFNVVYESDGSNWVPSKEVGLGEPEKTYPDENQVDGRVNQETQEIEGRRSTLRKQMSEVVAALNEKDLNGGPVLEQSRVNGAKAVDCSDPTQLETTPSDLRLDRSPIDYPYGAQSFSTVTRYWDQLGSSEDLDSTEQVDSSLLFPDPPRDRFVYFSGGDDGDIYEVKPDAQEAYFIRSSNKTPFRDGAVSTADGTVTALGNGGELIIDAADSYQVDATYANLKSIVYSGGTLVGLTDGGVLKKYDSSGNEVESVAPTAGAELIDATDSVVATGEVEVEDGTISFIETASFTEQSTYTATYAGEEDGFSTFEATRFGPQGRLWYVEGGSLLVLDDANGDGSWTEQQTLFLNTSYIQGIAFDRDRGVAVVYGNYESSWPEVDLSNLTALDRSTTLAKGRYRMENDRYEPGFYAYGNDKYIISNTDIDYPFFFVTPNERALYSVSFNFSCGGGLEGTPANVVARPEGDGKFVENGTLTISDDQGNTEEVSLDGSVSDLTSIESTNLTAKYTLDESGENEAESILKSIALHIESQE